MVLFSLTVPLAAHAGVAPSPLLGTAEGRCRPNETGPAFLLTIAGLKDRKGLIKVEMYPADDADFLSDDNVLVNAGKTFRRVEVPLPQTGPVTLCIRAPRAGAYGLSLLHDRDSNRKLGLSVDGIGLPGNPATLGPSKPRIAMGRAIVGNGPTPLTIRMMYRRGLFSFGPLK
ncbi:DUF2141 domain-containing protein [Sphingomonas sp.]|uniref:DUF2141 domain-containing protein n=1 Tax=Sphingomonas sp. TaxID=28214 RepID=UPI0025CD6187|nr:DUF2141 domain-containing protein [Sphingomonas sp.]